MTPDAAPRAALVLGGSGAIGSEVARALAAGGMRVHATYRRGVDRAAALTGALGGGRTWGCDLADPASVARLLEGLAGAGPLPRVLVSCAAPPLKLKTLDQMTPQELQEDIGGILTGTLQVLGALLPGMRSGGDGVAVTVLTEAIDEAPARMTSYVGAKAGLRAALRSLAREVAGRGVRLVGVSPSFVETPMLAPFPRKLLEIERARRPGGAFLSPGEVARVVARAVLLPEAYPHGTEVVLRDRSDLEPHR